MPIETQITFPQADVEALFAQMRRAQKELGKSSKESLKWAGATLVKSLGASTKAQPKNKQRPIVPNPEASVDRRRAKFGVMKYRKGKQVFLPIMKTTRGSLPITEATDPRLIAHKKRIIPRKAFAKRSWQFLGRVMNRGGKIFIDGYSDVGSTSWTGGETDPTVRITNRVDYMEKALKGGRSSIDTAMARASSSLTKRITDKIKNQRWTK